MLLLKKKIYFHDEKIKKIKRLQGEKKEFLIFNSVSQNTNFFQKIINRLFLSDFQVL